MWNSFKEWMGTKIDNGHKWVVRNLDTIAKVGIPTVIFTTILVVRKIFKGRR